MNQFISAAGFAILAALAVFQVALIAGAPLGRYAWGGGHTVLPARLRVASASSLVVYALFALILAERSDATAILPGGIVATLAWISAAYFFLGVLVNGISRSKSERYAMTPVALLLALVFLHAATFSKFGI